VVAGLGAFNQKGGLAAAAEALLRLADSGVPLTFAAVAGESGKAPVRGSLCEYVGAAYEGGGVGARWLLDHATPPDAVVITGPSGCDVVNAQPGYLMLKMTLTGRPVYQASKVPGFEGSSGIDLASRVVHAIAEWEPRYRAAHRLDCGMGTLSKRHRRSHRGWLAVQAGPGACGVQPVR
jgi:acetylornithine deacetylase/succinyl-diaminopimelate desuccinylase-like protein